MGAWAGKGDEGGAPLPRPGHWPLANLGTFAAGGQTQNFWPSRESVEWPMIRSPTSVASWPRQWPLSMFSLSSSCCSSGGRMGRGGISLQTCDTPCSRTIGAGTTMVSSRGTDACSGHGRLGERSGG